VGYFGGGTVRVIFCEEGAAERKDEVLERKDGGFSVEEEDTVGEEGAVF
jgi:hypothetical protein